MNKTLVDKLGILADAAKYDASCSSSGAPKRSAGKDGLGSTSNGICHAYTPDGRCISLLKILLTNYCLFDCAYCINRRSSNVARARFSVDEVRVADARLLQAQLHRRPVPLFRHHALARPHDGGDDAGGEEAAAGAWLCRLHPSQNDSEANPWLIEQAGLFADRLSINLELPDRPSA